MRQPQPVTIYAGGTAHFAVTATGSADLRYQWKLNSVNVPNATNATLTINNVQSSNAGPYTVTVTNTAGSTPSSSAQLTVTAVASNTYAGVIMSDQPAAYWRLDESSGTLAKDYAGGFDGTYMNGVTLGQTGAVAGDADKAATFDGVSQQKVEVAYTPTLNSTNFTVELWVKVTGGDGTYRSPLTTRNTDYREGYFFYATDGNVWQLFSGHEGTWTTLTGPAVQNGVWTHLAASFDGTTKRFYVNGALVDSAVASFRANHNRLLRLGGGETDDPAGNYFLVGDLDEVAFFNSALPANRILAHYGAGLGSTIVPTIATQPASQVALPGWNVSFSVSASGSLPLTYQWQRFSTNLVGATNTTLALNNVQTADNGDYRVLVHNPAGDATSTVATLTVVILPSTTYTNLVISDGAISYWRLDETSGTTGFDKVGGRDANYLSLSGDLLLGQPGALIGDANTSAGFDSTNHTRLEVPAYTPDLNTPEFTVECWAKATGGSGNYRAAVSSRNDFPTRGYILYATGDNAWEFWTGMGGVQPGWDAIVGPAVQNGQWVHLAGTFDGTTKRFFVNGLQVGSNTRPFAANDDVGVFRMGAGKSENPDGDYFLDGNVDEVAYYTNALSPAKILTHYALVVKPVTLSIAQIPGAVVLTWSSGTLESATNVAGIYTTVTGATSPHANSVTGPGKFFRVKVQ